MAQFVFVPFLFEFRVASATWEAAAATITGCWRKQDGAPDFENLRATFQTSKGLQSVPFAPLHLPEREWDLCTKILGNMAFHEPENSTEDERIETICSAFRPIVLTRITGAHGHDELAKHQRLGDAWQLREDFLRTRFDGSSSVVFLNQWGLWNHDNWVVLDELLHFQAVVRQVLIGPAAKWFTGTLLLPFPPFFSYMAEYPYFDLRTAVCKDAIAITVTSDLLDRLKFRRCARPDCRFPFAVRSKHKRKYCSQYCGHLESVRRNRAEQERAKDGG